MTSPGARNRSDDRGLTLVECVVAIVIVGTSVTVGLELLSVQSAARSDHNAATRATLILNREAEWIRGLRHEQLATTAWAADPHYPEVQVRRVVSDTDPDTRHVTVEVEWTSCRGDLRTEAFETVRCVAAP